MLKFMRESSLDRQEVKTIGNRLSNQGKGKLGVKEKQSVHLVSRERGV